METNQRNSIMLKNGKVIVPESTQTCILYNSKDGRIVHVHQVVTYPGGRKLNESEIESRALELAAKVRAGASGLKALHVTSEQFQFSKSYNVDVKSRRLIEQPIPKKLRERLAKIGIGSEAKQK